MNVLQLEPGTVNTDVEIHWALTNAIAMKGIHWKRVDVKVSRAHCALYWVHAILIA